MAYTWFESLMVSNAKDGKSRCSMAVIIRCMRAGTCGECGCGCEYWDSGSDGFEIRVDVMVRDS